MARICKWVRAKRISLAFCGMMLLAAGVGVWALAANGDPWSWPYEVWESGNLPRTLSFAEAKAEVEWMVGQEVNMVGTAGAWGEISSQGTPIDVPLAALGDPPPETIYIGQDVTPKEGRVTVKIPFPCSKETTEKVARALEDDKK